MPLFGIALVFGWSCQWIFKNGKDILMCRHRPTRLSDLGLEIFSRTRRHESGVRCQHLVEERLAWSRPLELPAELGEAGAVEDLVAVGEEAGGRFQAPFPSPICRLDRPDRGLTEVLQDLMPARLAQAERPS
jgi:hypothetical protein